MKQNIEQLLNNFHTAEDKQKKLEIGYELLDKKIQNGHYEDARKYGLETLEIATELENKDLMIKILTEIGKSFVMQGEYQNLLNFLKEHFT